MRGLERHQPALLIAVALVGYGSYAMATNFYAAAIGEDPYSGSPIEAEDRIDMAARGIGQVVGGCASGPKGPLFGRGRYRGGTAGLLNRGDTLRVGWSWDAAKGRNMFGVHGGLPETPTHWHFTPIPGPTGPLW